MATTQWYQQVNTSKRFRLGTEKKSIDGSVFTYGKGVASNVVGAVVVFNDGTFTPVLITNTPLTGQVGISASANTSATNFSWYLIKGSTKNSALSGLVTMDTGSADKVALSANSGTAGRVQGDAVHAGKMISGAWAIGISAANVGDALLNYPSIAGVSLA